MRTPENRERLQWALFPQGIPFQDGKLGTAVSCFAFTQLAAIENDEYGLASPTGTDTLWTLKRRDRVRAA